MFDTEAYYQENFAGAIRDQDGQRAATCRRLLKKLDQPEPWLTPVEMRQVAVYYHDQAAWLKSRADDRPGTRRADTALFFARGGRQRPVDLRGRPSGPEWTLYLDSEEVAILHRLAKRGYFSEPSRADDEQTLDLLGSLGRLARHAAQHQAQHTPDDKDPTDAQRVD